MPMTPEQQNEAAMLLRRFVHISADIAESDHARPMLPGDRARLMRAMREAVELDEAIGP